MALQQLLFEISAISKKYKQLNEKTGGYFNIFDIANIESDEITVCRVISELISPKGSHYQGDIYLKLFFDTVLKLDVDADEMKTAKVYREYVITKNRRVDIVIETIYRTIPIEVKIYASDQVNQCADYYEIAKNSDVYYLTLFGNQPSEQSIKGLSLNEDGSCNGISCVSFNIDILEWLDQCLKQLPTIKINSIREIILQFMSTIRKLTNQMEDNEEMEVKELIMKSPENMRSAIAIESSINEVKRDFLERFFKEIEKNVDAVKLINEYDYEASNNKKINDFYKYRSKSSSPGISYLYTTDVNKNVDIWVRLEMEWGPFIGYCTARNDRLVDSVYSDSAVEKMFSLDEATNDGHWLHYEWLPENEEDLCPDFIGLDDQYLSLYEDDYFKKIIDRCVERINDFLSRKISE